MATIQIRDIPEDAYEILRAEASAGGKSLQSYMREKAIAQAQRAKNAAVLRTVRDVAGRNTGTGLTIESILEAKDADRR